MRKPYAMEQMISELTEVFDEAIFETREPDGFDIWRTLVLDQHASTRVADLLSASTDQRIASTGWIDDQFYVRFVSDVRADVRSSFNLKRGLAVLEDEPTDSTDDREKRRRYLDMHTRGDLDRMFPDHADAKNKGVLIDLVLEDEFATE